MTDSIREQQPCIRCSRKIDAVAKICPYCNWDQSAAPPAHEPPKPQAVTDYRPPSEYDLKKKAMFAGAGALTLVAAFVVGMVINSDGSPKVAPKTVEDQLAEEQQARLTTSTMKRADTPLVAVEGPVDIEQPITSAPVSAGSGIAPDDYERTDATAVSATDYVEMAKRAKAEKQRATATLDPRSLTGPAYVPPRPRPRPEPPAAAAPQRAAGDSSPQAQRGAGRRSTRPIPEYQPLPRISATGTAKLSLMIGADGRVKEIDIERSLPRDTAQLISSVRSWRFKPATLNGNPVSAPYTVEISFKR
ncbi:MAG: energy transducer TonB [Acidobacteriota bacterium]|nr:energy transducer TonB [Acidobacteriota bacterium]